jgi:hypothetical protein
MIKKIWDRRRGHERRDNDGNTIDLPHRRKSKGNRKKGARRRLAAGLLLGLSTIMPVPGAKLIHAGSANANKTKISVAGSNTKKKLEKGSTTIFSGLNKNVEGLWLPPSFENKICESKQSAVTSLQIKPFEIFQPEDLMPAFSYSDIVYPVSMKHNVDWRLVAAVIQAESGFNADAVSPVGARGLMQLMPATAADYDVTLKSIHDPEANIEAGVRHLKMLSGLYDGDIPLIAAAYNAGQGTVAKFDGIPPFEETQTYVERVVSYYNSFAA